MSIRPIRRDDISRAAEVLTDAFLDDPFITWLFPSDRFRNRCLRSWTQQLRVIYVPKRHAYTTSGGEGVALWSPPGGFRPTFNQQLRMLIPYIRLLGVRRLPAAAAGFGVIERSHPSEQHWYLSVLGVSPAQQRSGFGRALLQPMLERADRERTLVYLETFKAHNVPYYERFGFRVSTEADVPGGPHFWGMSRAPVAPIS